MTSDLVQLSLLPLSIGHGEKELPSTVLSEAQVFIRTSARLPFQCEPPVFQKIDEDPKKSKSKSKAVELERQRAETEKDFRRRERLWQQTLQQDMERVREDSNATLQLADTLAYVNASFLSEIAYGRTISQCAAGQWSSQGVSPFTSPYHGLDDVVNGGSGGCCASSRTASLFPCSAGDAMGFSVRRDGSRQYAIFPVEEQRYVFLCVVPRALHHLMGECVVPWLLFTAVKGYPVPMRIAKSTLADTSSPPSSDAVASTPPSSGATSLYLPLDTRVKMVSASIADEPPHLSIKAAMNRQLDLLVPLFDTNNTMHTVSQEEVLHTLWWRQKRREVRQICTERHSGFRFQPECLHRLRRVLHIALRGESHEVGAHGVGDGERRFVVTSYALWLLGEPVVTNASRGSMEEVLLPVAISSTLEYGAAGRDRRWRPCRQGSPTTPTARLTSTGSSPANSPRKEGFFENRQPMRSSPEEEKVQVRCTAMYSSRHATMMAVPNNARGVVVPLFRPEDAALHSPGLLAVSLRSPEGWLLTLELEATAQPFRGAPLQSVLSGAQELLTGPWAAPEFFRWLTQYSATAALRRPVSLYSPSCVPLLQMVRSFRLFVYRSATAGSRWRSWNSVAQQRPELHCLFHLRGPVELNTDRPQLLRMEEGRSKVVEEDKPASSMKPSGRRTSADKKADAERNVLVACIEEERQRMEETKLQRAGSPAAHVADQKPKEAPKKQSHKQGSASVVMEWASGDADVPAAKQSVLTNSSTGLTDDESSALNGKEKKLESRKASEILSEEAEQAALQERASAWEEPPYWATSKWTRIEPLVRLSAHLGGTSAFGRGHTAHHFASKTSSAAPSKSLSTAARGCAGRPPSVFSYVRATNDGKRGGEKSDEGFIFHGVAPSTQQNHQASSSRAGSNVKKAAGVTVLFVVLELKTRKEQKELLVMPHHKQKGLVMDTREYAALSEWILSKALN